MFRTCQWALIGPPSPQNKLSTLKEQLDDGNQLDRDQQDAVSRINEVVIQLDLLKELQKQFCQLTTDVCTTHIPSPSFPQEKQNGTNFSSLTPSSEELWVYKSCLPYKCTCVVKVVTVVNLKYS